MQVSLYQIFDKVQLRTFFLKTVHCEEDLRYRIERANVVRKQRRSLCKVPRFCQSEDQRYVIGYRIMLPFYQIFRI